jgi:hypothetical protein
MPIIPTQTINIFSSEITQGDIIYDAIRYTDPENDPVTLQIENQYVFQDFYVGNASKGEIICNISVPTIGQYPLLVSARDSANNYGYGNVIINVLADLITLSPVERNVDENSQSGARIGEVIPVMNVVEIDLLQFSITAGNEDLIFSVQNEDVSESIYCSIRLAQELGISLRITIFIKDRYPSQVTSCTVTGI